ncbi:MAG: 2-phospho-L-lactate transferase [Chloroflexi bacterium]|nr:2-phospho-L-lactate transferase [Chloroflexota bacterium]
MLVALAGGVGAARFLRGLLKRISPDELVVVVNTGDDAPFHGLHVSPDIDTIIYTLAGVVDDAKGYALRRDTFHVLKTLRRFGHETWFALGDRDFATHVHRTMLLRRGHTLSEVTLSLCRAWGLRTRVLPMTDSPVETRVVTEQGDMHLQEYLAREHAQGAIQRVYVRGLERAEPAPGVIEALLAASGVVLCPSNPVISIGPILGVPGVRDALRMADALVVGVSPLVAGAAVKGPAVPMLAAQGVEPSACGVAALYRDFLDGFVIDQQDAALRERIEALGVRVAVTDTLMRTPEDAARVADAVLTLLAEVTPQ